MLFSADLNRAQGPLIGERGPPSASTPETLRHDGHCQDRVDQSGAHFDMGVHHPHREKHLWPLARPSARCSPTLATSCIERDRGVGRESVGQRRGS